MASQYLSRLGIVLGIDSGELVQGIEDAKKQFHTFRTQVEKDTKAAAREFEVLKNATEDYGKTLTKVEQIQREIERGRFQFASQNVKEKLLEQARAYDAQAAAMKKTVGVMTEQQKMQVGYQLTDFFTQVASGQNAMIAFIQQGGQLKDSMGGVGAAFRAVISVFSPLKIGLGAVAAYFGAIAYAAYDADKETDKFNDTLALTGNFAGITITQFEKMSREIAKATGSSISNAKDALMELVASGKFTEQSLGAVQQAVLTFARVAGISGAEAAKQLQSGLSGSASEAKSLNDKMNFLTVEQYKQIEALELAGKKQEAARVISIALTTQLQLQAREVGALEGAWNGLTKAFSDWFEKTKESLREPTIKENLAALDKQIETIQNRMKTGGIFAGPESGNKKIIESLVAAKDNLQEIERLKARATSAKAVGQDAKGDIDLRTKAGGLKAEIKLAEELEKLKTEAKFKERMASASEEMQIEIELEQKIAEAKRKEAQKNAETFNQFTVRNEQIRAEEEKIARAEAEKKRAEFRLKEQRKDFEVRKQAMIQEETVIDRLKAERDKIFANAETKREEQRFAKEELDAKFSLIGASQKELDILKAKKDYQKELSLLMRSQEFAGMSPEDQEKAKQVYEQTLQAKIANIELAESLQRVQGMYDAVWSNMSSAIENFVRTGKLSIKDLTKSIIQDMLIMNMKLQAMQLVSGLFQSFFGPSFSPVVSGGSALSSSSAAIRGRRAAGGPVAGGSTYLVGEQGPELFTPSGSGTIIPNNKMGQSAAVTNVTNNYINAIDAKSFEQRLLESNQAIWSANQYATKNMSTNFGRT
jgi:hypothetical protein